MPTSSVGKISGRADPLGAPSGRPGPPGPGGLTVGAARRIFGLGGGMEIPRGRRCLTRFSQARFSARRVSASWLTVCRGVSGIWLRTGRCHPHRDAGGGGHHRPHRGDLGAFRRRGHRQRPAGFRHRFVAAFLNSRGQPRRAARSSPSNWSSRSRTTSSRCFPNQPGFTRELKLPDGIRHRSGAAAEDRRRRAGAPPDSDARRRRPGHRHPDRQPPRRAPRGPAGSHDRLSARGKRRIKSEARHADSRCSK